MEYAESKSIQDFLQATGGLGRISLNLIYRRFRIGRDGHLDQSEAYDIS